MPYAATTLSRAYADLEIVSSISPLSGPGARLRSYSIFVATKTGIARVVFFW